ncbi:MAG: VWA domain-containing protein [Sandaracinaceae bacterium]|nr:VWA domain-containing protein [Sandaracinaceae bacterium]
MSLSAGVPQVAVASLSTSRPQIMSALSSAAPTGGNTPMFDALRAGWRYLDTLDAPGQRGVVLVTDGAETCDEGDRAAVRMQAATELATNHYLTFAVGLDHSNNDLSTIAYNGGTPRNDTLHAGVHERSLLDGRGLPGRRDLQHVPRRLRLLRLHHRRRLRHAADV